MTAVRKLIAYNSLTGEPSGWIKLDGHNLSFSGRALQEAVAQQADRNGWTAEQVMEGMNGHRSGYTVFLPEDADPPRRG